MKDIQYHFGCGGNRLEGFENFDMDMDLNKLPLPLPDGLADAIFIEHCLEHFPSPQIVRILADFFRLLKPGGLLRVCCPVLDRIEDRKHALSLLVDHGHCVGLTSELLKKILWSVGYIEIQETIRWNIDGHHRVIGEAKDNIETCRLIAEKP